MKLVKYLGIFMLFFVFAVGGMMVLAPKQIQHNIKVVINKDRATCFTVAADVEHYPKWVVGNTSVRKGRGNMTEVGHTATLIFANGDGKEMEMLHTVTSYVENTQYASEGSVSDFMVRTTEMEFESIDSSQTKLIVHITVEPKSLPARLFMYNADGTKDRDQKQYEKLKEIIEAI